MVALRRSSIPKYAQLQIQSKPVMVCEWGVEKGDNQAAWFDAAKALFPNYPRYIGGVL